MIAPDLNRETPRQIPKIPRIKAALVGGPIFTFCAGRSSTCLQSPPMARKPIASHCAWLVKPHSDPGFI